MDKRVFLYCPIAGRMRALQSQGTDMKSIMRAVLVAAIITGVCAPPLSATTLLAKSDRDMAKEADMIVVGRCIKTRSEWVGKVLVTVATMDVSETLKGSAKKTIEIVLPGGIDTKRKVPVAMTYAGAPTLTPNEQVFLFLTRDAELDNAMTITGFSQGKYNVVVNPKGKNIVTRNVSDARFIGGQGITEGSRDSRTLNQFKSEVQGYLKNPGRNMEKSK
jgi:hypothetical protein